MMRLINEDDVLEIIERVTNEAVEKKQPKYLIQPRIIAEISGLPTIEAEPDNGWISVKDRLPGKSVPVLICANGHRVTAYYDGVKEVFRLTEDENIFYLTDFVTHWMHLPEPPKEDRKCGI